MRSVIHQKYRTFAICIEYGWKIYSKNIEKIIGKVDKNYSKSIAYCYTLFKLRFEVLFKKFHPRINLTTFFLTTTLILKTIKPFSGDENWSLRPKQQNPKNPLLGRVKNLLRLQGACKV
jgi:hypothetical protein